MTAEKWITKAKNTGKGISLVIGLVLAVTGCGSTGQTEPAGMGGVRSEQTESSCDNAEQSNQNEEDFVNIEQAGRTEAVYLGVNHYGAEEVNKDNKDNFRYRFEIDGKEEILA
ncbi:MAG: hypothetical protein MRZ49_09285, partial [Lachnospiraceae bacterium]|nr:hypothetical protein [Lachnospiraceae bacterium]